AARALRAPSARARTRLRIWNARRYTAGDCESSDGAGWPRTLPLRMKSRSGERDGAAFSGETSSRTRIHRAILPLRMANAVLAVCPMPSQLPPWRSVSRKRAIVQPRTSTVRTSLAPQGRAEFQARTCERLLSSSRGPPLRTMAGTEKKLAAWVILFWRSASTQPRIVAAADESALPPPDDEPWLPPPAWAAAEGLAEPPSSPP